MALTRVKPLQQFLADRKMATDIVKLEVPCIEERVPVNTSNLDLFQLLIYGNTAFSGDVWDLPPVADIDNETYQQVIVQLVASFGPLG